VRPRLTMVCVTNRPHFAEVVAAQFDAQTWPNKELVIIDSSEDGGILKDTASTYVRAEPGSPVGAVRNIGLEHAGNGWLMWFDDDDWRHPELAERLLAYAESCDAPMAGLRSFFWITLDGRMQRMSCPRWPVFAAAVYQCNGGFPPFRTKPPFKTDSYWLLRVREMYGGEFGLLLNDPAMFVWVCHGSNVFNRDERSASRKPDEFDKRFLPDDDRGLVRHMQRIRGGVHDLAD